MNLLTEWLQGRFAETLGWTLIDSLWEIAAIGGLAAIGFWMGRKWSAGARYLLACAALLLMLAAPVGTYFYVLLPAIRTAQPAPSATPLDLTSAEPDRPLMIERPAWRTENALHTEYTPSWIKRTATAIEPSLPATVALYATGLALLLIRMAAGCLQLHRLARKGSTPPNPLFAMLERLRRHLAISRPVGLLQSAQVEVPTLVGFFRPIIFLPASALTGLSPDQLSALLAHELAHIRRHDYLINFLQSLIEILLFYHPVVWRLSSRIRQERENCCDDLAIALTQDRLSYANALASMESLRAAPPQVPPGLAVAARGAALLPRIRRILGTPAAPPNSSPALPTSFLLLLLVAAAFYFGCRKDTSAAQSTPPTTTATKNNESLLFRMRILLVPTDFLEKLPQQWDPSITVTGSTSESWGNEEDKDKNPGTTAPKLLHIPAVFLDDAQAAELLRTANTDKQTVTVTSPRVITPSGIRAAIAITQSQNYIAGDKIPPTATAPNHELDIKTLTYGITANLSGSLSPDRKIIATDLHFKYAELRGIDTFTSPQFPGTVAQLPKVHNTHIDATLQIPAGQIILLRGPTVTTEVQQDQKTPGLSDLPAVGGLFTKHTSLQQNRTMLLLLTAVPEADAKKDLLTKDQPSEIPEPNAPGTVGPATLEPPSDAKPPANTPEVATEVKLLAVSPALMDDFRVGYNVQIPGGIGKETIPPGGAAPKASIIDTFTLNLFLNGIHKQDAAPRTLAYGLVTTPAARWTEVPINYAPLSVEPSTATQPAAQSSLTLRLSTEASPDRKQITCALGPTPEGNPQPSDPVAAAPEGPLPRVNTRISVPDGGTLFINLGQVNAPSPPGGPEQSDILILLLRPKILTTTTQPATAPASK